MSSVDSMIGDEKFQAFMKKILENKRRYILSRSIKKKDKRNYLNINEKKFRPDTNVSNGKVFGLNVKRGCFDGPSRFNEMDC